MILSRECEDSMENRRTESETSRRSVRAIALLSGGLDSTLAAAIVKRAGIEVVGLTVKYFVNSDERRAEKIAQTAQSLHIRLRTLDLSLDHLQVIKHPRHGYGSAINPCIDCRIFMLKHAKGMMEEERAQFVVTGEVLGQRPMSQHRDAMDTVAAESGLDDRLLRPLSANLLPDTLPVKEGWIAREALFAISGRSRQEQVAIAAQLGITDYPQPGGGCILTDKVYGARLRDAFTHVGKEAMGIDEFVILRHGRQFRLSERAKLFVGRNERENTVLEKFAGERYTLDPTVVMGPLALIEGEPYEEDIQLAASIAARYCDHTGDTPISLRLTHAGSERVIEAPPLSRDDSRLVQLRIGG